MSEFKFYRTRQAEPITWRIDQKSGTVELWAKVMKTREDRVASRRGEPRMEWVKSGYRSLQHINDGTGPSSPFHAHEITEEEL